MYQSDRMTATMNHTILVIINMDMENDRYRVLVFSFPASRYKAN